MWLISKHKVLGIIMCLLAVAIQAVIVYGLVAVVRLDKTLNKISTDSRLEIVRMSVVVLKDEALHSLVTGPDEGCGLSCALLAEVVELDVSIGARRVVRTLDRLAVRVVVLLVVREQHELRHVHEPAKNGVAEAGVHAVSLRNDALAIVLPLCLHEGEREPVHKEGDVGPEAVLAVLTGKLSDHLEGVVRHVVEVDEAQAVDPTLQAAEERTAQVVCGERGFNLLYEECSL